MSGIDCVRERVPLAERTWFKLGGPAQYFAEPSSVDELKSVVARCHAEGLHARLLGGGSKVLVRDEGVAGMIISLVHDAFTKIKITGRRASLGGGANLANAITMTVGAGLAGLEPLVGIPGTVGGALHGNAGSHGGDIGQWACGASVMARDGEIIERERGDLVFAYRQSSLDELVILSTEFELEEEDPVEVTKRMQKQWIVKKANLPMAHENTGCIFKNPRGMSAGMLIDQCGLKGESVGGAEVSQRHANFFVAKPGATAKDVLQLIDVVRNRVAERMGVELETEIEIW
ncbi:MAG TPA: UDP-N-acetylmuramate dehydrogenase [Lacipirellulaceae bacterium]|nr:UDP-N-acetylmuramate dehydrogenase [Lacipirellulaceae bacterium]